jgi:K+-transporting ATPase KdpF subunit
MTKSSLRLLNERGMTGVESVIGLVLSVLAVAYLVYALLLPERLTHDERRLGAAQAAV